MKNGPIRVVKLNGEPSNINLMKLVPEAVEEHVLPPAARGQKQLRSLVRSHVQLQRTASSGTLLALQKQQDQLEQIMSSSPAGSDYKKRQSIIPGGATMVPFRSLKQGIALETPLHDDGLLLPPNGVLEIFYSKRLPQEKATVDQDRLRRIEAMLLGKDVHHLTVGGDGDAEEGLVGKSRSRRERGENSNTSLRSLKLSSVAKAVTATTGLSLRNRAGRQSRNGDGGRRGANAKGSRSDIGTFDATQRVHTLRIMSSMFEFTASQVAELVGRSFEGAKERVAVIEEIVRNSVDPRGLMMGLNDVEVPTVTGKPSGQRLLSPQEWKTVAQVGCLVSLSSVYAERLCTTLLTPCLLL